MPLLSANNIVSVLSMYPDRVVLNFQFCIPPASFSRIASLLHEHWRFRRFRNSSRGTIRCDPLIPTATTGYDLSVSVTRPAPTAPLSIFLTINPLAILHSLRNNYGTERGRNSANNWLHPDDLSTDNSHIVNEFTGMLWLIEPALSDFADALARQISQDGYALSERVTLRELEVVVDLASSDPGGFVRRLVPVFRRHFNHPVVSRYGESAISYQELEGDSFMVSGFPGRHQRMKLYEKTNERVRLECQIGVQALKNWKIDRSIRHDEGLDFGPLFARIADTVFPYFEACLRECREAAVINPATLEELFAGICSRTSSARGVDLIRLLARNNCISTAYARGLIDRLIKDGILERIRHGACSVAAHYRCALESFRNLDAERQGFLRGILI
jgi:hypothetical protein